MPDTPDFSVVVPTYNGRPYVQAAVRSVLSQTHDSYEVIVSDDGSTDDTVDVLEALVGDRDDAVILRHRDNRGLAANTNAAVERSSGTYLAFLDQDDTWAPEKLRSHRDVHESEDADVVYSDSRTMDADGTVIETVSRPAPASDPPALLRQFCERGNFLSSMSFITIRRSCWVRAGGFDSRMAVCADLDLLVRLARSARFARVAEPLAWRRLHGEMQSRHYREKFRDNERIRDKLRRWGEVDEDALETFTALYTENRALGAFYEEHPREAIRYAIHALATNPNALAGMVLLAAAADLCSGPFRLGQRAHAVVRGSSATRTH